MNLHNFITIEKPEKIKLEYVKYGVSRKTLLVMHGGGTDFRWMIPFMKGLSKHYTVYSYAQPGFGFSDGISLYTMSNLIQVMDEVIKQIENEELSILGHSFGGGMALRYLVEGKYRSKIKKAFALSPLVYAPKLSPLQMKKKIKAQFAEENRLGLEIDRTVIDETSNPILKFRYNLNGIRLNKLINETDWSNRFDEIKTPLSVFLGENDLVLDNAKIKSALSEIRSYKLTELKGMSHSHFLFKADEIIDEIING